MKPRQLLTIFLATLSGVCFGVAVSTLLLTKGVLSGGLRAYIVQSGSMEPALSTGSVVLTKTFDSYNPGEIITFSTGGRELTTHRIVGIDNVNGQTVFRTKGDANEEVDNWTVQESQIVGRQIFSIPKLGYLADFVKTPKGFVILVVIPASIIVYEELKAILSETRKMVFKKRNGKSQNSSVMSVIPIVGIVLLLLSPTASFSFDTETSLSNIFGGVIPSPTPNPLNLVINEFMPQPISPETEWVEIYNPTASDISLVGWALDEVDQSPKPLDALGVIPANGFVVYQHTNTSWLDNGGETLELLLLDPQSQVIDSHTYPAGSAGVSVGRDVDGSGVFKSCTTPTKGTSNNTQC